MPRGLYMRKRIASEVVALLLLIAMVGVKCSRNVIANPNTITVPSPGYETIQKAINAANIGDIIMVDADKGEIKCDVTYY